MPSRFRFYRAFIITSVRRDEIAGSARFSRRLIIGSLSAALYYVSFLATVGTGFYFRRRLHADEEMDDGRWLSSRRERMLNCDSRRRRRDLLRLLAPLDVFLSE